LFVYHEQGNELNANQTFFSSKQMIIAALLVWLGLKQQQQQQQQQHKTKHHKLQGKAMKQKTFITIVINLC
jgi:sulfite exporter TauE/SafE